MRKIKPLFILFTALIAVGFVQNVYAKKHRSHERPTPINLTAGAATLNGTYDIERFVVRNGDEIVLNSDNGHIVRDDKGELTLSVNADNGIAVDMTYKMQMTGESFDRGGPLAGYAFLYDNKTFKIDRKPGTAISDALGTIGMHIYDRKSILWEMPYKNGMTLILKLEKETDSTAPLTNEPYLKLVGDGRNR